MGMIGTSFAQGAALNMGNAAQTGIITNQDKIIAASNPSATSSLQAAGNMDKTIALSNQQLSTMNNIASTEQDALKKRQQKNIEREFGNQLYPSGTGQNVNYKA